MADMPYSDDHEVLNTVRTTLILIHMPGSPFEIRVWGIPGKRRPYTASGYYTDPEKAALDVLKYDKRRPRGIYTNLNPLNPALLARSPEQMTNWPQYTTADNDIIRRLWLPVDVVPDRPAGVSSTDEELLGTRSAVGFVASEV